MADVKFSDFGAAANLIVGNEQIAGLQGGANVKFTPAVLRTILLGYKSYHAIVNQSASSAPVATVLKNELSGTPVWTRVGAGLYVATLTGQFTLNKTVVITSTGAIQLLIQYPLSVNAIEVDATDGDGNFVDGLAGIFVEIRVYN